MKKILLLIRPENTDQENSYYIQSIKRFGGEVICVLDSDDHKAVLEKLNGIFGILLPGGNDVGRLDFFLIEYALNNNLRLFGICQGMQSMALYGTNNKLIEIGNDSHKQCEGYVHSVVISNSRCKDIVGQSIIKVNSHHRQTVLDSFKFRIVGRSDDLLIEVVENSSHPFQIGVQWHPERMLSYDKFSILLFQAFLGG